MAGDHSPSSTAQAILAVARRSTLTFTPGTVIGAGVYLETRQVWQALLLACLVGPPIKAVQKVAAQWIELLAPPRRWRRPRRRGS